MIRCLPVIGEASQRLSKDLRAQNPEVPWREMAGMRDRLEHAPDQVEPEEIRITLQEQLPPLKTQIEALLEEGEALGNQEQRPIRGLAARSPPSLPWFGP